MGAGKRRKAAPRDGIPASVLDRAHLSRYTMENPELEREIIGLFLRQLPNTLAMLREAQNLADWKLAAHTLKGSAAAIGAMEINRLAVALESCGMGADRELITQVEQAALRFEAFCRQTFG